MTCPEYNIMVHEDDENSDCDRFSTPSVTEWSGNVTTENEIEYFNSKNVLLQPTNVLRLPSELVNCDLANSEDHHIWDETNEQHGNPEGHARADPKLQLNQMSPEQPPDNKVAMSSSKTIEKHALIVKLMGQSNADPTLLIQKWLCTDQISQGQRPGSKMDMLCLYMWYSKELMVFFVYLQKKQISFFLFCIIFFDGVDKEDSGGQQVCVQATCHQIDLLSTLSECKSPHRKKLTFRKEAELVTEYDAEQKVEHEEVEHDAEHEVEHDAEHEVEHDAEHVADKSSQTSLTKSNSRGPSFLNGKISTVPIMNEYKYIKTLVSVCLVLIFMPCGAANFTVQFESNVTAFQSNCSGGGSGMPRVAVNASYNCNIPSKGVSCTLYNPETGFSYYRVSISLRASNHNTTYVCELVTHYGVIIDTQLMILLIQGPLDAPLNFSVTRSNTSNTSFTLSWGAPFSLHNTQGLADIFNYTLCTNTTCRTIPSKPNCKYPRHCISFVNLAGEQSIGTASYDASIEFSLSAVNGAGEGLKAKYDVPSVTSALYNSPAGDPSVQQYVFLTGLVVAVLLNF